MIVYEGFKQFIRKTLLDATDTCKVFLVKADFGGSDGTLVFGDLTEADFAGYARQVYDDGSGVADLDYHPWGRYVSGTFLFQPSGIAAAQTIYGIGVLIVDFAGDKIIALERFDAPVVLTLDTDKVERGIDFYSRNFTP